MDVVGLNQKFLKDLIEGYKNRPCLWKVKSPEYKNKSEKAKAYEELVQLCKKYIPVANREYVKSKINSLRTCFRKEWKKVQASLEVASDDTEIYKPHLWYYDLISFTLADYAEEKASITANEESSDSVNAEKLYFKEEEEEEEEEDLHEEIPFTSSPCAAADDITSSSFSEQAVHLFVDNTDNSKDNAIAVKRKKANTGNIIQVKKQPEDIYDVIGRNVAYKLRSMTERQRIIAEKIVSDVMYHGQMEHLSVNSHLKIE